MRNLRHSFINSVGFQPQVLEYQITLKMGDGLEQKQRDGGKQSAAHVVWIALTSPSRLKKKSDCS